jgi:lipopolysaccharide heptosyltransferase II
VTAAAPSQVVVLAPNWLGDVIMALPALASLRQLWPRATLTVAARPSVAPLLNLADGIDQVLVLGAGGGAMTALTSGPDEERLAAGGFEVAVLLPNSFRAALLVRRAKIPERWGYATDFRRRLLTRAVAPRPSVHHAEYYLQLATALGGSAMPLVAALRRDPAASGAAARLLSDRGWPGGPLVVFAPGAAFGPAKRWPPDRAGLVAARVSRDVGATPVLVGSSADRYTAADVSLAYRRATGAGGPALVDLTGETDLPMLAGVLSQAAAVVSNDSGALHLAAALGVPVAGLFGPTNDQRTSPLPHPTHAPSAIIAGQAWCRPCELRRCPIDHRCMTSITVDRVSAAVGVLLGRDVAAPGDAA